MERVLGFDDEERPRSEVIDLGTRPSPGGTVTSAVQITTIPGRERARGKDPDERG